MLEAADRLGYIPQYAARSLARQRNDTLTAIFPSISSGFFAEVLQGINLEAQACGYGLNVVLYQHKPKQRQSLRTAIGNGRADAAILMNVIYDQTLLEQALDSRIPVVLINRPMDSPDVAAVLVDNVGGARAMMDHLLDRGCRRIVVISGPKGTYDVEQRLRGCREAFERRGGESGGRTLDVWPGEFYKDSGYRQTLERLRDAPTPPDAIFALNDAMALGALRALRELGLDVPGRVRVAGFDDIDASEYLQLTTVRSPLRELGRAACRAAVARIAHPDTPPARQVLGCELVVRGSTATPCESSHAGLSVPVPAAPRSQEAKPYLTRC